MVGNFVFVLNEKDIDLPYLFALSETEADLEKRCKNGRKLAQAVTVRHNNKYWSLSAGAGCHGSKQQNISTFVSRHRLPWFETTKHIDLCQQAQAATVRNCKTYRSLAAGTGCHGSKQQKVSIFGSRHRLPWFKTTKSIDLCQQAQAAMVQNNKKYRSLAAGTGCHGSKLQKVSIFGSRHRLPRFETTKSIDLCQQAQAAMVRNNNNKKSIFVSWRLFEVEYMNS